ncbi:hypothetical protein D3C84_603860 [compost metagenome]
MQNIKQSAYADAADFLVMGQGQLQWAAQRAVSCFEHGVDRQGNKSLHVAAATAVNPLVLQRRLERRHAPGLSDGRHHVGVSGQQHARQIARANAGEQVGLASTFVLDDQRLDTFARQLRADIVDQRKVRFRGNGLECDQSLEYFQRTPSHDALLLGSALLAKRLT